VDTLSYKTISANKATVNKEWVLVDAEGQALGRLASKVAKLIRGKHKPNFTPHVDCGDNVIVINADKITLSGNKWTDKSYIRHTGYPGGQKSLTATELYGKDPARVVEKAVKGMLPKNKLGSALFRNLTLANYFTTATLQYKVKQPLALTNNDANFDITVNVYGGGITGQAEAVRLALSRAMCEVDAENRLISS